MYGFILDKSAQDSKNLIDYLNNWKSSHNLRAKDFLVESIEDITSILKDNIEKLSTVVAVGDEKTFEMLISRAQYFEQSTVVGYIPTNISLLSKRLGLKDYKQACAVISQRKIINLTALSVNDSYFLFSFVINCDPSTSSEKSKIKVFVDSSLQISLNTQKLVVHNRNQELMPHHHSLLIEAFGQSSSQPKGQTATLFKLNRLSKAKPADSTLPIQLRVPANKLEVVSNSSVKDIYNTELNSPIQIGNLHKTIRLIAKRGQEMQSIMSPGLIS